MFEIDLTYNYLEAEPEPTSVSGTSSESAIYYHVTLEIM